MVRIFCKRFVTSNNCTIFYTLEKKWFCSQWAQSFSTFFLFAFIYKRDFVMKSYVCSEGFSITKLDCKVTVLCRHKIFFRPNDSYSSHLSKTEKNELLYKKNWLDRSLRRASAQNFKTVWANRLDDETITLLCLYENGGYRHKTVWWNTIQLDTELKRV